MRLASVNGFDKSTTEGGDVIPEELVDYSTDDVLAEIDVNQDGMMQLSEVSGKLQFVNFVLIWVCSKIFSCHCTFVVF